MLSEKKLEYVTSQLGISAYFTDLFKEKIEELWSLFGLDPPSPPPCAENDEINELAI